MTRALAVEWAPRIAVAVDWLWSYLSYQCGARLITGEDSRVSATASKP
jgi:hypothetical protein